MEVCVVTALSHDTSATQCLRLDHERLHGILLEAEREASLGRFPEARQHFREFAAGLSRHIDVEESVLFPELEQVEPRSEGPIRVMNEEHILIREMMALITSQLATADRAWRAGVRNLKEALLSHNTKEERVLYPMADDAASGQGSEGVLSMQLAASLGRAAP
jgi:iron-sulfur cluster repair protein YtfE (RIC family)